MRLFRHFFNRSQPCLKPVPKESDLREPDLQDLLNGYRYSALLYVAAKFKIADLLADGPRHATELAEVAGIHAPTLQRILQGLAVPGFCTENSDGRFQLTPQGSGFKTGAPAYHLAILIGEEYMPAWNGLAQSVVIGKTAFDLIFGESPWEHRQKNPDLNQHFNAWLKSGAGSAGEAIVKAYDFTPHQTVAEVGGGNGTLLAAILKNFPSLTGILFDQSHVISTAQNEIAAAGVPIKCRFLAGDFFKTIPAGADVYILKSVLHDWDDEKCRLILMNCHAAMKPGQRLLVIERVLPPCAADMPAIVMMDLHMLAVTGGRERTAVEYQKLFSTAGFEFKNVIALSTGHSLLEIIRS